jgi:N-glycosylase/DNA lyase
MTLKKIRARLEEFKNLSEEQIFQEFRFCLLTPQSQAQRCWSAVLELTEQKPKTIPKITKILESKTRFHHTKAKRIIQSQKTFSSIKPLLTPTSARGGSYITSLRNHLAKEVNGYGLKEASHFLRNIGLSNNKIAILDRHILRNLHDLKLIPEPKIKNPKHYLEIEQIFLAHAQRLNIKPDELDLLWWSQENGEIFK